MQSDPLYTSFFKYIFLLVALLIGIFGITNHLFPQMSTTQEVLFDFDLFDYFLLVAAGLLAWLLHLIFSSRIVQVRLGAQRISILNPDQEITFSWLQVESLAKVCFVTPPLYTLRIKNKAGFYLFTTQNKYIQSGFGVVDLSEMGALIKKKKKALGI